MLSSWWETLAENRKLHRWQSLQSARTPFSYTPLNTAEHEIRVLDIIVPTSPRDPVTCKVRHISLDSQPPPEYETISYYWGSATLSSQILLDGYLFQVPANTELALRRVTSGRGSRVLWIDAVCINQLDMREREQQVAMMGKVFSLSKRTLVYLGEADKLTDRALDNIAVVLEEAKDAAGPSGTVADLIGPETISGASDPLQSTIDEEALIAFFSHPWFSRVWIVQEVVLSTAVTCLCGPHTVCLSEILDCAAFLRIWQFNGISSALSRCKGLFDAAQIWKISTTWSPSSSMYLADLLVRGSHGNASDARDKVFGILGLHDSSKHSQKVAKLISPDYGKTAEEVLRDAVRYSIIDVAAQDTGDELYPLRFVEHSSDEDLDEGFPTWAPRFDRPLALGGPETTPADLLHHTTPEALREMETVDVALAMCAVDPNVLRLRGHFLDEVVEVFAVLASGYHTFKWYKEWLDSLREVACKVEGGIISLARTLTANTDYRGKQSQDREDLEGFEERYSAYGRREAAVRLQKLPPDASDADRGAARYWSSCVKYARERRVTRTYNGHLGMVPKISRVGDVVVVLDGNIFPSVLRPDGDYYRFIGNCYIDGIMRWQEGWPGLKEKLNRQKKQIFALR